MPILLERRTVPMTLVRRTKSDQKIDESYMKGAYHCCSDSRASRRIIDSDLYAVKVTDELKRTVKWKTRFLDKESL
jgi:hypothetical protein